MSSTTPPPQKIWPVKDPTETLDYTVVWSQLLSGDRIESSSWTANDATVTVQSNSTYTNTTATVWLSGGTANTTVEVTNTVTTSGGRTFVRSAILPVNSR
jgi:hypothetical protein